MVRWQDINELLSEVFFFKKRSRSRTIWIRGGLLTSFLALLGALSLLTGVTIETSGDIYGCGGTCNVSVNITSTYYRIGVESFPIYFDKDIPYEIYVPTRGKNNWRPFVPGEDFIERKNKYNYLPNRFLVTINKSPYDTVKYGVKMIGEHIDPYIYADNIHSVGDKTVTEICNKVYDGWIESITHYKNCTQKEQYFSKNDTTMKAYDYTCFDYREYINHTYLVGCIPTGQVKVNDDTITCNDGFGRLIKDEVICIHNKEGGRTAPWWSLEIDDRLDPWCWDLKTDEITFDNKLKTNLESVSLES